MNRHMESLYRGLCVRSNMLFRNFTKCINDVKCLLFQSFCTSLYCLPLIIKARVSDMNRLKVCYNNSLRKLFNFPRQSSVSALCVQLCLPTFIEVHRKAVVSLLLRLKSSNNLIIQSLANFTYFQTTVLFQTWKTIAYSNH